MEVLLRYKRTFPELFFVASWSLLFLLLLTVLYPLLVFFMWYALSAVVAMHVGGYVWRHRRDVIPLDRLLTQPQRDGLPQWLRALWRIPDGREHPAFPVLRVPPPTLSPQRQQQVPYALVTGGAMGIGRELCVRLWDMGYSLVVWDVASDKLKELDDFLNDRRDYGRSRNPNIVEQSRQSVIVQVVDVSNANQVAMALSSPDVPLMDVQILILNAGVVSGRLIRESDALCVERTFGVNVLQLHHVTRLFLQHMKRFADSQGHGQSQQQQHGGSLDGNGGGQQPQHFQLANITIMGSVAGFAGAARVADYNASKAAANLFAEALRSELRLPEEKAMLLRAQGRPPHNVGLLSPDAVRVTLACPYIVNTGMFAGTRDILAFRTLSTEYVAESIVDAISHGKDLVVVPWAMMAIYASKIVLPNYALYYIDKLFGASSMMDDFAGKRRIGAVHEMEKKHN